MGKVCKPARAITRSPAVCRAAVCRVAGDAWPGVRSGGTAGKAEKERLLDLAGRSARSADFVSERHGGDFLLDHAPADHGARRSVGASIGDAESLWSTRFNEVESHAE